MESFKYEEYEQDDIDAQMAALNVNVSDEEIRMYETLASSDLPVDLNVDCSQKNQEQQSDTLDALKEDKLKTDQSENESQTKKSTFSEQQITSNDSLSNYLTVKEMLKIVSKMNQDIDKFVLILNKVESDIKEQILNAFTQSIEEIDLIN